MAEQLCIFLWSMTMSLLRAPTAFVIWVGRLSPIPSDRSVLLDVEDLHLHCTKSRKGASLYPENFTNLRQKFRFTPRLGQRLWMLPLKDETHNIALANLHLSLVQTYRHLVTLIIYLYIHIRIYAPTHILSCFWGMTILSTHRFSKVGLSMQLSQREKCEFFLWFWKTSKLHHSSNNLLISDWGKKSDSNFFSWK